jgi:signal transduction histidine kinase
MGPLTSKMESVVSPSRLPLFWKLLLPFLVLIVIMGAAGTYVIVRDLSLTARVEINEELLRRSVDARARVHDRELYILESLNFAANLRGMAEAVKKRDSREVSTLLRSVLALKTDLKFVAITLPDGRSLIEFVRESPGGEATQGSGTAWGEQPIVSASLPGRGETKAAGFLPLGETTLLAIAGPICSTAEPCASTGSVIAGVDVRTMLQELLRERMSAGATKVRVGIYDDSGALVAASGKLQPKAPKAGEFIRLTESIDDRDFFTLYSPIELQGTRGPTLAVSLAADSALGQPRGAGLRFALIVFLGMGAAVLVGVLLSRYVLTHIRALVETSRSLGRGDLGARAQVSARDELGELAHVLNQMADEVQASHTNLERRVEERTSEIERLLRERTDFFAGISHELRTPIAVIVNQARRLLTSIKSNETRRSKESISMILESADQLLDRVNDILELARAEAGGIEIAIGEVNIPEVIESVRPTVQGLASGGRHNIKIKVEDGIPPVQADPTRLKDVVMNLVDNAVKYTPAGGTIELTASARNGTVDLSVEDSGPGIPNDVGEMVFEPFYRVPGIKTQRGEAATGLGLALTKRLVEAQGGKISYTSKKGRGTMFTVSLIPLRSVRPNASK